MTNEKFIDFSISTRNSNFVIIKISNSCNKNLNTLMELSYLLKAHPVCTELALEVLNE